METTVLNRTPGATVPAGNGARPARRKPSKQRRRTIVIGAVVVLAVAAGAWYATHRGGNNPLKDLQTAQAFKTTLLETVSAQGMVDAETGAQVNIGSQISGVVKRLYADVGGQVKAGQIIAELDLPDVKAQQDQSKAALSQMMTKLQQQQATLPMTEAQDRAALQSAMAALRQAQSKQVAAQAAATQQPTQTSSDIARAEAALTSAQTTEAQAHSTYKSQLAAAQAAVQLARATQVNASANLKRQEQLFHEGYIAASDVDTARTSASVADAQLSSAQQNLQQTQVKVNADLQTASQAVVQAQASLRAAKAETYTNAQSQANLMTAQAATQQAQEQLKSAQAAMTQDELKRQDVAVAGEAVTQSQAALRQAQAQYAKTFIKSPISGTVLALAVQQGETLAAGLSAPTLISVADLSRLQVDAYVDETDIGKVKLGQSATVTVDAFPDKKFMGKVTKIAAGATTQNGVITYDTTIAIQDPGEILKPSMTASVTIAVSEHDGVVVVPNEAVKTSASGSTVWIFNPGMKTPEMATVQAGATDGTYTEIDSGVNDKDTVVLAGWPPPGGFGGKMQMTPFGPRPTRGPGH